VVTILVVAVTAVIAIVVATIPNSRRAAMVYVRMLYYISLIYYELSPASSYFSSSVVHDLLLHILAYSHLTCKMLTILVVSPFLQ
jgi:hypothetical protein